MEKPAEGMDFVHDQLATGRKLRVLTIVDTFSRFSPAIDPRFSYRGEDVVLTLERICKSVGYPKTIRAGSVRNFVCEAGEPSCLNEPFVEHDGELGLCLEPFARRHFPLSGGLAQDEKRYMFERSSAERRR